MKNVKAENVFSGSHGELWIDGDYMAEVESFEAKISFTKADVNMVKKMFKQYKITGYEGSGKLTLNKVSSYMLKKLADDVKEGKQTVCTVISKINDPDAIGAERIAIKDVTFNSLQLANWKANELGTEEIEFNFTDFDILDSAGE